MTKQLSTEGAMDAKTILNWTRENLPVSEGPRGRVTEPGQGLNLVYAGNIGGLQDLETVIDAVASLNDLPGLHLNIYGSGVMEDSLREYVDRQSISNVTFNGHVSREILSDRLGQADFQLIPLRDLKDLEGTVPSKLQGCLREGIPVISTARGDTSSLVHNSGSGLVAAPNSSEEVAASIRRAYYMSRAEYRHMSSAGKKFYKENMSLDSGITQLEALLHKASTRDRKVEAK